MGCFLGNEEVCTTYYGWLQKGPMVRKRKIKADWGGARKGKQKEKGDKRC